MRHDQKRVRVALRNLLAVTVAIALSCVLAGCGAAGTGAADPATAVSTTTVFPSRFTAAGYQALRAYLRLDEESHHEHGLPLARIERLQPLCAHLGPNAIDLEVQGLRSACTGSLRQARAVLEIPACKKLAVNPRRQCVVNGFSRFASASEQVVGAENGMFQVLAKGPCDTFLHIGVSQDRRLLGASNNVVEALQSYSLTRKLLNTWQRAFDADFRSGPSLAVEVRRSKVCRPV